MTPANDYAPSTRNIILAIVLGGLVAATGDIVFAFIYYPVGVQRVLQSVAAGLIGRDAAISGGWETAAIGAACHYSISIGAAAVLVLASRIFPALTRYAIPAGLVFGICVYFVMNAIVVPLSAAGRPFSWGFVTQWIPLLAHMFLFGLPVALIARYFTRR